MVLGGTVKGSITKLPVCSAVNVPVMTFVGAGAPQSCGAAAAAPGARAASSTKASRLARIDRTLGVATRQR